MAENVKRLQFLLTIMEAKGMGKHDLAALMGKTPQNIFTYFKRDDMKLSVAQDIFAKLGYELSFRLTRTGTTQDVVMDVENLIVDGRLSRLAFLRIGLAQYGISRQPVRNRAQGAGGAAGAELYRSQQVVQGGRHRHLLSL